MRHGDKLFQDHEKLAPLSTWMGGKKGLSTSFRRYLLLNLYFWLVDCIIP